MGPLVNAWNFGPDREERTVPDAELLAEIVESTGFDKLAVRLEPPALKKTVPGLEIDLSAVAKGYAVDRVVALLNERGAKDVFVEIGGEVSVSGSKAGQWWKVGIQMPDAATNSVLIAHSLNVGGGNDRSMATSGDYRNFFEVDGNATPTQSIQGPGCPSNMLWHLLPLSPRLAWLLMHGRQH